MGHRGVVGEFLLPAGFDQAGFLDLEHIAAQGQAHHIGLQPINHGTGLGAGTAVAGFHFDGLTGLGLPVRFERRQDAVVGRFGDGVAHQQQLLGAGIVRLAGGFCCGAARQP